MKILKNISLKNYNTFGIEAKAKQFISVNSKEELKKIVNKFKNEKKYFLGGGSNILITKDIDGIVIHLNFLGKTINKIDENFSLVHAKSGENWHELVKWCISKNLGGIENLSLIPGNVGAAPIQNIGAYGVEIKDSLISCEVFDLESNNIINFKKEDCFFTYRSSVFKKNKNFIILSVNLKLSNSNHNLNLEYGSIKEKLSLLKITKPTILDVSNIVTEIRNNKLPDPKKIGNCGSFFKNPIISNIHLKKLKETFKDIPYYTISENEFKIPAAWLIEKAGFKGKRIKNYGVHKKQALVLVNYSTASGKEILNFSKSIEKAIKFIFEIELQSEVNII